MYIVCHVTIAQIKTMAQIKTGLYRPIQISYYICSTATEQIHDMW